MRFVGSRKFLSITAASFALAVPMHAHAQGVADDTEDLQRQLTEIQQREIAALERVEELEGRLSRLEALARRSSNWIDAEPIGIEEATTMRGRYVVPSVTALPGDRSLAYFRNRDLQARALPSNTNQLAQSDQQQAAPGLATEDEEVRKAPAPTEAVEELTGQQQGRFGDQIGFELGFGYSHFDNARINLDGFLALDTIFLGTIRVDEVTADVFTIDPTLRWGVTDNFFVNASVPYLYRTSNYLSGGAGGNASGTIEESVEGGGLGDASIGMGYRLMHESAGSPDVVLNGRLKFPTGRDPYGIEFIDVAGSEGNLQVPERLAFGSGVYGASVGLSVLKTLDPMVVFGSVNYFNNFDHSFGDISEAPGDQPGRISVGNAVQFGAGLAFALNERSSISMSYTQRLVEHTRTRLEGQEWLEVAGSQSNVALTNLGATFSLSERVSLIGNVGIGLTNDSPDMVVSIRLPVTF